MNKNNLEYRIASESDYEDLLELRWGLISMYDDVSSYNKDEFAYEFKQFLCDELGNNYNAFVAVKDNEVISNIYLGILNRVPSPIKDGKSIGYITNVFTKEKYRNLNIGSELINYVIEYAKSQDCEVLFVWPSEGALTYYQRAGFTVENEIMEKALK